MSDKKIDIKSLNLLELQEQFSLLGEKKFHAKQVYEWIHKKYCRSFEEMTNISKNLRSICENAFTLNSLKAIQILESSVDGTRKYLFALPDGNIVESVFMRYKHGNSVCISSQVGCRMGCKFCASTLDGLVRNLEPSEMLDQIYEISRLTGEKVANIVVMGAGEPFDNYDNLIKFIRLLTNEDGCNLSARNITVSTCGLVPKMKELASEKLPVTLALSLHATTDTKRKRLMPIANKYKIEE